jgi:hypothetical protein
MDLCLWLGTALWLRSAQPLTLAWQHSVERVRIEEEYEAADAGVVLGEVRLRGLGAGLDVPTTARLVDGWWRFKPSTPALREVRMADSSNAAGYRVCAGGRCRRLPTIDSGQAVIRVCDP